MRLVWVLDGGWPRPRCNPTVYTVDGDILGRPDLLDPIAGVAGEYDGALHRTRARHRSDVERAERFLRVGLESFVVVAGDSVTEQLSRMESAYARARSHAPGRRRWTLDPPSWAPVPPHMSLDEELDLRGWAAD